MPIVFSQSNTSIHHTRLLLEVSGNKRWLTLRLLLQYLCKVFIFGLLYTIHFCFTHFRSTAIVFLLLLFVCFLKMMFLFFSTPPILPFYLRINIKSSDRSVTKAYLSKRGSRAGRAVFNTTMTKTWQTMDAKQQTATGNRQPA